VIIVELERRATRYRNTLVLLVVGVCAVGPRPTYAQFDSLVLGGVSVLSDSILIKGLTLSDNPVSDGAVEVSGEIGRVRLELTSSSGPEGPLPSLPLLGRTATFLKLKEKWRCRSAAHRISGVCSKHVRQFQR